MNIEIRRSKLDDNSYGEYIDMWITGKRKELHSIETELMNLGYQEAIEECKHSDGTYCFYFSINIFDVPTIKEVREDYKRAKKAMRINTISTK